MEQNHSSGIIAEDVILHSLGLISVCEVCVRDLARPAGFVIFALALVV